MSTEDSLHHWMDHSVCAEALQPIPCYNSEEAEAGDEPEEATGIHLDLHDLLKYQMGCLMEEMILVRAHLQKEGESHYRETFGQVLTHILVIWRFMCQKTREDNRLVVDKQSIRTQGRREEDICQREAEVKELSTQIATK
ncbi:hypothetical protein R1flu_020903 [Riccia fluitans]|uniref:Uncharacterized protein n=1 Tax=Riccia fluitans TaxID=41844 RepID=A0ABD1ZPC1_9MARC